MIAHRHSASKFGCRDREHGAAATAGDGAEQVFDTLAAAECVGCALLAGGGALDGLERPWRTVFARAAVWREPRRARALALGEQRAQAKEQHHQVRHGPRPMGAQQPRSRAPCLRVALPTRQRPLPPAPGTGGRLVDVRHFGVVSWFSVSGHVRAGGGFSMWAVVSLHALFPKPGCPSHRAIVWTRMTSLRVLWSTALVRGNQKSRRFVGDISTRKFVNGVSPSFFSSYPL